MAYRVRLPRTRDEERGRSEVQAGSPMFAEAVPPVPAVPAVPQRDHVLAYRVALREWWRLVALGPEVDRQTALMTHDEVIRLIDEIGEPPATGLRWKWEAEWTRETGRCPRCGERHDEREREDTR